MLNEIHAFPVTKKSSITFTMIFYTEHCSVGPTNFIETIGTARLKNFIETIGTARLKISAEDF